MSAKGQLAIREATHAGSWYSGSSDKLSTELSSWLDGVSSSLEPETSTFPVEDCKAIIAPHAGYSYSGRAAAWGYKCIKVKAITRVFILGPSHHVYLDGCALSSCSKYKTPLGDLPLDLETIAELSKTGKFGTMSLDTDEEEHSIEMHLPYVRKVFEGRDIKIVPILVGSISTEKERQFGAVLSSYLDDPSTLFVVSSDFCHWGTRFSYTRYQKPNEPAVNLSKSHNIAAKCKGFDIHESIKSMDKLGMEKIAFDTSHGRLPSQALEEFASYLAETRNTICGRHPIGVLLGAISALQGSTGWTGARLKWTKYEQSSACKTIGDSSVSYASASVTK